MENDTGKAMLELEKEALGHLAIARKWSLFLARLGFIFFILLLVLGIFTGIFLTIFNSGAEGIGLSGVVLIGLMVITGIFYVLPVYYLWLFSKNLGRAIKTLDKSYLRIAFRGLRYYFVFLGVLAIVMITMYVVIIGVGGALMAFLKIL